MIDQSVSDSKLKSFFLEYRQEIKFVVTFLLCLLIGFKIIYNDYVANNIIIYITEVEATAASKILNLIGFANEQNGLFISGIKGNVFSMKVLNTCNGVYESVIFLVAFIAIQVPWRRKLAWMGIGFAFFHFVNLMRLVSLFIVGCNYSHETFVFFHETFWNLAIVIVALLTFVFCAYQVLRTSDLSEKAKEDAKA